MAFLGPAGTFTEQALHHQDDLADRELLACDSMVDALFAVNEGTAAAAVVPIENAIEGTVNATVETAMASVAQSWSAPTLTFPVTATKTVATSPTSQARPAQRISRVKER